MVLAEDLDSVFVLPFSQVALDELLQLQQLTENIPFDESLRDTWLTIWGGNYTSSKFYHVFQSVQAHPVSRQSGQQNAQKESSSSFGSSWWTD